MHYYKKCIPVAVLTQLMSFAATVADLILPLILEMFIDYVICSNIPSQDSFFSIIFDLEKYPLGTQVRVMSWENYGTELSGTIEAISDTPTNGYDYYGSTNPNTSFYSATIAVGADADLREGEYVSVYFSAGGTDETALYLPKMYLRSEGNRYYAYRRGADGLLEKGYVEIGDSYYDAVHVLGGLTLEDRIAFPYGKNVKDGAQTVESEEYAYYGYDIYY